MAAMRTRLSRVWRGIQGNWPYLMLLCFVVLPMLWMAASLALRSGLLTAAGPSSPAEVTTFLTFIGGSLGTAATLAVALLTRGHNSREHRRLQLETAVKCLESLPSDSVERLAGILPTMVLLGQPRIAMRTMEPVWQAGKVDSATATWVIDQVLTGGAEGGNLDGDQTTDAAINEASVLLRKHADSLTEETPLRYSFPGHFLDTWYVGSPLPQKAKYNVLLAMGQMLAQAGPEWWCPRGGPARWPAVVLMDCVEREPDDVLRTRAAVLLGVLIDLFPERFERYFGSRRVDRVRRMRDLAVQQREVPSDLADLVTKIESDWQRIRVPR